MQEKLPVLFCVGTNHESAGLDFRETLFLSHEDIDNALPLVVKKHHIQEIMVLSTCNRLELYGVLHRSEVKVDHLMEIFVDLQKLGPHPKKDLENDIIQHSYRLLNQEAVQHAFSVASGLDSLVLGETQITGQFKEAAKLAVDKGTMGPILKRLSQEAFSSSKKVRTRTDISKKPVSISHAAIDLANRVYGHIKDYHVLIVGAGEMAEVAAKYALKYKPQSLSIINRTFSNGQKLVDNLGSGKAYAWEDLHELLPKCDVIISSTAANEIILSKDLLKRSQSIRDNRPTFIIDIALPRDVDSKASELDDVFLFDIDDLKQVVGENFEERRKAAEIGKTIINENSSAFISWMNGLNLKPALSGFRGYLTELFEKEKTKSLAKGPLSGLTIEQSQALDNLLKSISNKLSGDAGRGVRNPPEGYFPEDMADALKLLFPQDRESKK